MNRAITPEEREKLLTAIENPPLGTPLNQAKRYGVDLRALVDNLCLTPTQRALKMEARVNRMLERARRKQLLKANCKKNTDNP